MSVVTSLAVVAKKKRAQPKSKNYRWPVSERKGSHPQNWSNEKVHKDDPRLLCPKIAICCLSEILPDVVPYGNPAGQYVGTRNGCGSAEWST